MRILFIILFLLGVGKLCYADFYILVDKETKEIINTSTDKKDFIISEEDKNILETIKMPGEIEDYDIEGDIQDYKIATNRIVVNTKKVSDKVAKRELNAEILAEQKMIDNKLKEIAIDALKADGKTLKHIKK